MQIIVIAGGENQKTFQDKEIPEGVLIQFYSNIQEAKKDADGYFYLLSADQLKEDRAEIEKITAPIFVVHTCDINELPLNAAIIEGWPKFLFEKTVKVQYHREKKELIRAVLNSMQWDFESEVH